MDKPQTAPEDSIDISQFLRRPDGRWPVQRTVGFGIECWYFPELDQWEISISKNGLGQPIIAVGPLRLRLSRVRITR